MTSSRSELWWQFATAPRDNTGLTILQLLDTGLPVHFPPKEQLRWLYTNHPETMRQIFSTNEDRAYLFLKRHSKRIKQLADEMGTNTG